MRQQMITNLNTVAPIAYAPSVDNMLSLDALTLGGLDIAGHTNTNRKWIDAHGFRIRQ